MKDFFYLFLPLLRMFVQGRVCSVQCSESNLEKTLSWFCFYTVRLIKVQIVNKHFGLQIKGWIANRPFLFWRQNVTAFSERRCTVMPKAGWLYLKLFHFPLTLAQTACGSYTECRIHSFKTSLTKRCLSCSVSTLLIFIHALLLMLKGF